VGRDLSQQKNPPKGKGRERKDLKERTMRKSVADVSMVEVGILKREN